MAKFYAYIGVFALFLSGIGCVGHQNNFNYDYSAEQPDWVNKIPKGHFIGISDPWLVPAVAQQMAVDRGRSQVVENIFNNFLIEEFMFADTSSSVSAAQASFRLSRLEQRIIGWSSVHSSWISPGDGTAYSLVNIDKFFLEMAFNECLSGSTWILGVSWPKHLRRGFESEYGPRENGFQIKNPIGQEFTDYIENPRGGGKTGDVDSSQSIAPKYGKAVMDSIIKEMNGYFDQFLDE